MISDEIKHNLPYQNITVFRFYDALGGLCLYQFGEKTDSLCKMDIDTRKRVIRSIASTSSMYYRRGLFELSSRRHGIPIVEDYQDVALPFERTPARYRWEGLTQISYIISSILSDETRISYPRDEFIRQIIQSSEFSNLVDYVLKKRANSTTCTRENIVMVYKKLLAEFYDAIHEADDSEADAKGE